MAQFGNIADWLEYDRINQANQKANLVGEALEGLGVALGKGVKQQLDKKGKKGKKDVKPTSQEDLLVGLAKAVPNDYKDPTNPDPSKIPTLQDLKERPKNDLLDVAREGAVTSEDVKKVNTGALPPAVEEKVEETPLIPPAPLAPVTSPSLIDISTGLVTPSATVGHTLTDGDSYYGQGNKTIDRNRNVGDQLVEGDGLPGVNFRARNYQNYSQSFLQAPTGDNAYGPQNKPNSGINRLSPFPRKATVGVTDESSGQTTAAKQPQRKPRRQYDYRGDNYLDAQALSEMIDPAAVSSRTAQYAVGSYNASVKERAYSRMAWEKTQKGIEDVFSTLEAPKSGVNTIDGAMTLLSQQAKHTYLDLQNRKNEMSPGEYTLALEGLKAAPRQLGQAMGILKQRVEQFAENRHSLSKGNNKYTLDVLDSLAKNEGSIVPEMRDGIAYLTGKTALGEDVNVAMSEILNGKNDFKFLTRFDPSATLNTMVDKYGKMKTEAEFRTSTGAGVKSRAVPIESFENDVRSDFNKMLNDPNVLRSVVADYLGADYDTFEEIKKAGLDPKQLAINELYDQFKTKFNPVQEQVDIVNYKSLDPNQQRFKREEEKLKLKALKNKASGQAGGDYGSIARDLLGDMSEVEVFTSESGPKTPEEAYKKFPNLRKLVGSKGIKDVTVEKGALQFFGKSSSKDGKETVENSYTLDLTQPYDVILQQVANIAEQTGYKPVGKKKLP